MPRLSDFLVLRFASLTATFATRSLWSVLIAWLFVLSTLVKLFFQRLLIGMKSS